MKNIKGQLSIEYLIVLVIFIIFISYFIVQLQLQKPVYMNEIISERLRSEAYQMSELLINDPGYPIDWENSIPSDISKIKRIGLSNPAANLTNLLSIEKINAIGPTCAPGYAKIKEWTGSEHDFSLYLIDRLDNNNFLIECNPTNIKIKGINTTISRYVTFDKSGSRHYGELILQMW